MEDSWATFWQVGLPVFTTVITVFGFLANFKNFIPVFEEFLADDIFIIALFKAIVSVYWPFLLAIVITIGVTMSIHQFVVIHGQDQEETYPTPTIASTEEPTSSIFGPATFSLDDFKALRKAPHDAFYFHQWEENFPIKIGDVEYPHSIGVRLPIEVIENLYDNYKTERKLYSTYIEYSLGYKYDVFQFDYGIDDSAFKDYDLPPPSFHYWILVESCSCLADSKERSKELYTTPEVNYMQTKGTSKAIDVSNVETLRLTFYWKFDVLPTKPLTLNVAIVDPTLYVTGS